MLDDDALLRVCMHSWATTHSSSCRSLHDVRSLGWHAAVPAGKFGLVRLVESMYTHLCLLHTAVAVVFSHASGFFLVVADIHTPVCVPRRHLHVECCRHGGVSALVGWYRCKVEFILQGR